MKEKLSKLFFTFMKIGIFTIGGGYAMIPIVKDVCVDKEKWLTEKEFLNMIAIAECTPGPVAINMATYVGFRKRKWEGAISSTLGVILPSMIIIYIISMFFKDFLNIKMVRDAFFGIRIAIGIIIFRMGIKLFLNEHKKSNHKGTDICTFIIVFILSFIPNMINKSINTIYIIIGVIVFSIIYAMIKIKKYDIC